MSKFGSVIQTHPKISPIQFLLLIQLETTSKYGYEMLKSIRNELGDIWIPKTGTIYPALKSLTKQGYIKTIEKEGVDFYEITNKGLELFDNFGNYWMTMSLARKKYLQALSKWISPRIKKKLVETIISFSKEDLPSYFPLLEIIDGTLDYDLKTQILQNIKNRLTITLEAINSMYLEMEKNT